jgi:hypothetical protein
MPPKFSLCHATRRLPEGWLEACDLWFDRCDQPEEVEYIIAVDADQFNLAGVTDYELLTAMPEYGSKVRVTNSGPKSAGAAWNEAVKISHGQFIITVADDLFPPPYWDTEIQQLIPDFSKEAALWPDLSGDYGICTFPFITRPYLERLTRDHGYQGGAWYPEYTGMRADDDFTACATMDGVWVKAPELKFEHKHPTYGTAEWDETYQWQHRQEAFQIGDSVLERRRREGFKT